MALALYGGKVLTIGGKAAASTGCCCPSCYGCAYCQSGTLPEFIQVEYDGIANDDCDECTDLNSMTIELKCGETSSLGCAWSDTETALKTLCSGTVNNIQTRTYLELSMVSGHPKWTLDIDNTIFFSKTYTAESNPCDCSLARTLDYQSNSGTQCDATSATATITPLT